MAVGFALGTYPVSLAVAVIVIGAVSVAFSLVGLELGSRLGSRIGQGGELIGGLILIGVRHQLRVLRRQVKRPVYRRRDRALLAAASRILPKERWGAFLVRPETLLRWHRSLVARKWTRPHRPPGRPAIDPEVCKLILPMARENPRWGYMRIKGELGKLGIRASATSIAMLLRRS